MRQLVLGVVSRLPRPVRSRLRRAASKTRAELRRRRRPRWGNMRRTSPFSDDYGFDRGTPIDRHYLRRFFGDHASLITGAVLEVKDPAFTDRYGREVRTVDLVDIDPGNRQATVLADLAEAGSLPPATWDCVIAPQTLHLVDDPAAAVANLWQAVRPGGTLFITVPTLARQEPSLPQIDRWRFLPRGLEHLLQRGCPGGNVTVVGYGNLLAATAFLYGLASEELRADEVDLVDPAHVILACGTVERPA